MIKIGIRAHDMGKYSLIDFPKLLNTIKTLDGQCIQLALGKSFIDFNISKENLNSELSQYLKNNLENKDINLSVLGCYINMGNPDDNIRHQEIEKFKYHLDFSKNFPGCIVGTETGCLTTDYTYTPLNDTQEAFDIFLDTLKKIVKHAEKTQTLVAIEGVSKDIISTPEKMNLALKTIVSNHLKVIFDPVNFLNITNFHNQKEIIEKSFELFADKIAIIHLKDFKVENNIFKIVPIGQGNFDIDTLMKCIKKYNLKIDILLENSNIESAKKCIHFVKNSYKNS
ncbi:MAG: sugar phosphate isomerase/epimerase family protein [Cetobacterium somerae]|uniref:AP endonuclease, family 2 n=1 Tax=Cetobacterium somerae ATCC BAA-474 TaxID=1319815 RepID=U7V8Q4_9FUSO|nr:TIM barrel protein [Cetobacterium somerae]ERT67891.1 AP endonuclease, family 2 [Cetobacterium somerae ATCC BAA-474]